MKRILPVFLSLAIFCSASVAFAALNDFEGRWKNQDEETSGMTTLVVDVQGIGASVHPYGKCHPADCDWGTAPAIVYGSDITSDLASSAAALVATYNDAAGSTSVVITRTKPDRLQVSTFRKFTDASGRKDYTSSYTFVRAPFKIPAITVLVPPQPVKPSDGAVFSHFPRTLSLVWEPVKGASAYVVEIDCLGCCSAGGWCTDAGQTFKSAQVTGTSYTFDFVGAQSGRWRVAAVGANGHVGPKSPWVQFRFTR